MPCATLTLSAPSAWSAARPILAGSALNAALTLGFAWTGVTAVAVANLAGALVACVLAWRRVARELGWSTGDVLRTLAPGAAALLAAVVLASLSRLSGHVVGLQSSLAALSLSSLAGLVAGVLTWLATSAADRAHTTQVAYDAPPASGVRRSLAAAAQLSLRSRASSTST
jgi:hypothetical protein